MARKAFNGKGVVIVKSTEKKGSLLFMLILQDLAPDQSSLQPFQARNRHFVAFAPVKATTDVSENPKLLENCDSYL